MEQTNRFGDKLQELADLLEEMTGYMMLNAMDDYQEKIPTLSALLETCFPKIIISYSEPALSEVASDATYWSEQLGRLVEVLNKDDKFARIDALYHESRTNLIAYLDMIKDTPIADWDV